MFARLFKKKSAPPDRAARGKWGEKHCLSYLKKKGFKFLDHNFRCRQGEIDLIMADSDGTVVFVEVKTRENEDFTDTEDVITFAKKSRMKKAARLFLAKHKIEDRPLRFDVVTIVLNRPGPDRIKHYPNAFS